jgi:hypothetical protein
MAYDEGLAELMRGDLADISGITEKKMFGGLCFMLYGNMVGGVHTDFGILRVGKDRMESAQTLPGTGPMAFTGRPMGGFVEVSAAAMADDDTRKQLLALALENAGSLPPK